MQKAFIAYLLLSLLSKSCSSQDSIRQTFGTKNIDHHEIANDFMTKIKNEKYESCYELLSEDYKENFDFEDFKFKMKMLNDLSGDEEFYHYNTTFIGKTAKEGLALLDGKEVKTNIMPQYDFTVESESKSDFKSVQIFIRFDHEDSDKISVINYAKHTPINEKAGISSMSINPFIIGKYILIAEVEDKVYIDIRGGELRDSLEYTLKRSIEEPLIAISLNELTDFIETHHCADYSLIHIGEKGKSFVNSKIRVLADNNGFSVFNHISGEFKSISVDDIAMFQKKYKEGNWNPIK